MKVMCWHEGQASGRNAGHEPFSWRHHIHQHCKKLCELESQKCGFPCFKPLIFKVDSMHLLPWSQARALMRKPLSGCNAWHVSKFCMQGVWSWGMVCIKIKVQVKESMVNSVWTLIGSKINLFQLIAPDMALIGSWIESAARSRIQSSQVCWLSIFWLLLQQGRTLQFEDHH